MESQCEFNQNAPTHNKYLPLDITTMEGLTAPRESEKYLTNINIAKILSLGKALLLQWKIAALMKCSQKAIQHTLVTYIFETFQGKNPRRDYQWKTTEHKDQYIECTLKQKSFLPLRDITNILGNQISQTTLRCWWSEAGLDSCIVALKSGLHDKNIVKRLEWAMKYKDWTVEDWKCIIWSDELSI